jgi:mono/diheme cytochrome c family protein
MQALLAGALAAASLVGAAGCRQDMHDQPKIEAFERSLFFADERGARPIIQGTVPRGVAVVDTHLENGKDADGKPVTTFPFPVTKDTILRGQDRFNIYCSPCHGRTGEGDGMIVRRGFKQPTSYHIDRLRQAPPGYFYDVIKNGFATMPDYAAQIPVNDRWAIVAYIRALQLSRSATLADVPEADKKQLEGAK